MRLDGRETSRVLGDSAVRRIARVVTRLAGRIRRALPFHSFNMTMTHDPAVGTTHLPLDCRNHRNRSFRMLTCPECSRRCKSLSGLRRHQSSVHRNDPGLSIPVTEVHKIYHPNLNGTYNTLPLVLLHLILCRPAL